MGKYAMWISLLLVVVLPSLLMGILKPEPQTQEVSIVTETVSVQNDNSTGLINILHDGRVQSMELEAYICGVLLGEMPAEFHEEALKAQAVATRTYTLRKVASSGKHPEADVCTDPNCCQAFTFPFHFLGNGEDLERINRAVNATKGQVLTYDGELIEATYYSCSGGRTEAAVEVWGADVPYLQALDSPGEEIATHYRDEVVFTAEELSAKLGIPISTETFHYSVISYTDGEGIDIANLCGKQYSGTELRSLLGLRSTAFTVEKEGMSIKFITKGFGHRVGMSQYGAEAMALNGSSYAQILSYYYPGTELYVMQDEDVSRLFDKEGIL